VTSGPLAVHHHSVAAPQILDHEAVAGALDRGMEARYGRVLDRDVVLGAPPDAHLIAIQLLLVRQTDRRRDLEGDHRENPEYG